MVKNETLLVLDGESLRIEDVADVARNGRTVALGDGAAAHVAECCEWVDQVVARGKPVVYGVNTGFGVFANVNVDSKDAATLSRNLILSHSVGVGAPLSEDVVRAAIRRPPTDPSNAHLRFAASWPAAR